MLGNLKRYLLNPRRIAVFVLDEADQMLGVRKAMEACLFGGRKLGGDTKLGVVMIMHVMVRDEPLTWHCYNASGPAIGGG